MSAVLATDTTKLNKENIDIVNDDEEVRHELIATSSATINRRLRRDAVAATDESDKSSETLTESSPAKTDGEIAVGIPEKFVTSSAEQPAEASDSSNLNNTDERRRSVTHKRNSHAGTKKTSQRRKPSSTKRQPLTKQSATAQKKSRARGTLYGLSTLRRQGNVRVNVLGDYTNVKSNFVLGPLVLKVEKAFGQGTKRELKSATATTTQMIGRISLRIINGAATLHSIKVQQPKQVNFTVRSFVCLFV